MSDELTRIEPTRKTGEEHIAGTGRRLLEFWQWALSDLMDNTNRALLGEYLVAAACGCDAGVKDVWASHDLQSSQGVKIEVKTTSRIQAWAQSKLSPPSFSIRKTRSWNAEKGSYDERLLRHSDVYVFCVLAHEDQATIDPLDTSQWDFYVVPTRVLAERHEKQKNISLGAVKNLPCRKTGYRKLAEAVREAAANNRSH